MLNRIRAAVCRLLINLIFIFYKGDLLMMAMLFACRVVEGRTEWDRVPAKLKPQVAEIIVGDFALPELVPVEFGGTADVAEA